MRIRAKLFFVLGAGALVLAFIWGITKTGSNRVEVSLLRFESVGRDVYADMELRNASSRVVVCRSGGPTTTHYAFEAQAIDWHQWLASPEKVLAPGDVLPFRVLVLTPNRDWRVGVDVEIRRPQWVSSLPRWSVATLSRVGLLERQPKKVRVWSSWTPAQSTNSVPNKPAAGNAGIASQLAIEHHWPGVPEPGRDGSMAACSN